jgi:hypothetical protein
VNKIGEQCRQEIIMSLHAAVFDRHIAPLDVTGLGKALPEGGQI